jgi:hypothetical protein
VSGTDSLLTGLMFLSAGLAALLFTAYRPLKNLAWSAWVLSLAFGGLPMLNRDIRIGWTQFEEFSILGCGLFFVVALVRCAKFILTGNEEALR